jgi:hypothetical protein
MAGIKGGQPLLLIGSLVAALHGCETAAEIASTCAESTATPIQPEGWDVALPACSEWIDRGEILAAGEPGAWDHLLYGGFAGSVVKTNGTLFLYYQGARAYSEHYGTVTDRAIGVATSANGLTFTKFASNPVITWSPNAGHEEGAVSAGASIDVDGRVAIVYGANTSLDDRLVTADGRLALSPDGFSFTDAGPVLDQRDAALWGRGDEVFPVISIHDGGSRYVYYIPNGTLQRGRLGVAWGPGDTVGSSTEVSAAGKGIDVWGMGGAAKVGPARYALFLNDVTQGRLDVRTVSLDRPDTLSAILETYAFDDFSQGTVYLDRERGTWFLFYRTRDASAYRLRTAVAVSLDRP